MQDLQTTIDKIVEVVDEQVDKIKKKSGRGNLTVEDTDRLSTLADIVFKMTTKVKTPRKRPSRGSHLSDKEITDYAKG